MQCGFKEAPMLQFTRGGPAHSLTYLIPVTPRPWNGDSHCMKPMLHTMRF